MNTKKQFYEFVLVLDPRLSAQDMKSLHESIEKNFPSDSLIQKDDIGLLDTSYPIKKGSSDKKAYYVSYYMKILPSDVVKVKKGIMFLSGILRQYFFRMNSSQKFYTYKQTQEKMKELFPQEKITHI